MIKGFDSYTQRFSLQTKKEINLGLDRILGFLTLLDSPQNELTPIHIAGTNGKGSTLQFLRYILIEAGYSVGTFTSPHILSVNDQISTNNGAISEDELNKTFTYILSSVDKKEVEILTDFELLTVLAIVYFSRINKQDFVIFETGMGGLNDSTNVIMPLVSIITTISLDHTSFLGSTVTEIALQKAGIIKKGIPSVTGVKNPEALQVIKDYAHKLQSPLSVLGEDFWMTENETKLSLETPEQRFEDLQISMKGKHQKENAALAIMTVEVLVMQGVVQVEQVHIEEGVRKAFWPGRFEFVSEDPAIILDGAHNPDAIERLVETLKSEYPGRKLHFIFGALRDKDVSIMIKMLEEVASRMSFVDFEFPRAASALMLADICRLENKCSYANLDECLRVEINSLHNEDVLVIAGSLYLLAEVKERIGEFLRG
jgi:dihydrofolate synthase / folylpolyglutamate synthase